MPNKKRRKKSYQPMSSLQTCFWIISISAIIMIYLELHIYASMARNKPDDKTHVTLQVSRSLFKAYHRLGLLKRATKLFKPIMNYFSGTPKPQIAEAKNEFEIKKNIHIPQVNNGSVQNVFVRKNKNTRFVKTIESFKGKLSQTEEMSYCFGNLHIYNNDVVILENIILVISSLICSRKGGEKIDDVIGQDEASELVRVRKGFLRIQCGSLPPNKFKRNSDAHTWYQAITILNNTKDSVGGELETLGNMEDLWMSHDKSINLMINKTNFNLSMGKATKQIGRVKQFTIMVRRGDYANLYWTLVELYNVFLTIRLCGENESSTTVLFMDAHPAGHLDSLWMRIFDNFIRVGHIENKAVLFRKVAWNIIIGPIRQSIRDIPYIAEFKKAVLKENFDNVCNLKGKPVVTLVLRRDYVAHPRNRKGVIKRKISNEKSLIQHLNNTLRNITLLPVQLDKYNIDQQLDLIKKTWILIGVHGAGLGFGLLLTPGATLIEIFPASYRGVPNPHFQQFASYAGANYKSWFSANGPKGDEYVNIPPVVAENLIREALFKMCNLNI